ncbi:peptide ABC transporter substrate-binding protein [Enterococcus mediterraneensis]|uniref:peptide ABC transporter substrate-binding protein n=1 Tax=Enterococcus mediterraneensis TaxID=2364791 RepID=UPI0013DFE774|nr:peptide ABC transporter substrate-binding protein [Enterococcus mediterraneensis]
MTIRRTFSLIAASFLLLMTLAACSANTKKETVKADSDNQEKIINMMEINEISSMDSGNALDGGSFIAITQVFEGLYNLDEKDNIIPGVAEKLPTISEDGLTYTVPLRKNAVWSNGDPVTAHDFVYAWQRVVTPEFGSPSSFLLADIKNANKILAGEAKPDSLGVKAKDDYTLEVTLEHPVAYFTSVMTFPTLFPQNQKYVEKQGKNYALDSEHMIYNGPYRLAEWKHGNQKWVYQKNDRYWNKEQSNVEAVNIQVVKDTNLGMNLFKDGQLDRAVLSGEFAKQYKNDPNYTTQLDSWVHTLELNQKRNDQETIFANKEIRQAIGLAIDREHIVNELLDNDSRAAYGLIPAEFVKNPETKEDFRKESGNIQSFDTKQAKTLWKKGLESLGKKEVTLQLAASDQDENKAITEYLQYTLQENLPGLTVEITLLPEKNLLDKKQTHDFDLMLTRQGPDFQDPTTFLNTYQSEAFNNPSVYSNPAYDKLLTQAQQESTQLEKRWQTLIDAEHVLLEDAAVIPIYQSANTALLRENITGMIHHLFGPPNFYGKIMLK